MYRLLLYIYVFICLLSVPAYGALDSVGKIRYDLETGLPSNSVYSILQDRTGAIWFATDNGVVKYNGYSFRVFTTNDGLPSSDVWNLYEDKYGRIWFYCYASEIGYIRNDICHKLNYKMPQIRRTQRIWEHDGDVFIEEPLGFDYMVCKIDSADNITSLDINDKYAPIVSSIIGNQVIVGYKNYITKPVQKGLGMSLQKVMPISRYLQYESPVTNNYFLKPNAFLNVEAGKNRFFLNHLYTNKLDTFTLTDFGGNENEKIYTTDFVNTTTRIYSNEAIYTFDSSLNLLQRQSLRGIVDKQQQVSGIFADKTGNNWASTANSGALMLPAYQLKLTLDSSLKQPTPLKYIGKINDGTLCWWSDFDKKVIGVGLNGKVVFSFYVADEELWSVTDLPQDKVLFFFRHEIIAYNLKTKKQEAFLDSKAVYLSSGFAEKEKLRYTGHTTNNSARMFEAFKRQLFYSVYNIAQYAPSKYLFFAGFLNIFSLTVEDDAVSLRRIGGGRYPDLLVDKVTNLNLFYNKKNIQMYSVNNDFREELISDKFLNIVHSNSIMGIYADGFSNVYLHLDNRLLVYNMALRWWTEIPVNINLIDTRIVVHKNVLILSGGFGLAYVKINGALSFGELQIAPNIKGAWYNRVYQMAANDSGKIYLNTDKGVFTILLDSLTKREVTFNGGNNNVVNLVLNNPYIRHIDTHDTVSLSPGLQSIALDVVNFYGLGNRYFVYRLNRRDKWQKSATGEILITNLKPGIYYPVQVYVVDELWKSRIFTFYLYRQPHWYETTLWKRVFWVSAVLITVLLIAVIIFVTRFYVNQSNKKKSRLLDLELRAVYSQINPHFIFNTLSSALFFINRKQFDDAYSHVSKFSKLLRAYLKSSQERYTSLAEEIGMLRNYIELQQIRFEKKFAYSINLENKIPAESVKIPSLLLQPLVENAINHGLFHKQGQGNLDISFLQGRDNNELICIIEDDGVGRIRASEINKQSIVKHDSYGTKLTQKLIDIFKEYEQIHIFLEYKDKSAPLSGTIVKLTLRNLKYDA